MLKAYDLLTNVSVTLMALSITLLLLSVLVFANYSPPDIYDLWNSIEEFESTSSLRRALIEKDWVSEKVTMDELDYILVLTQQCSRDFFPKVPTSLVLAMISVESGFRRDIRGFNDDTGLMQVIPKYHLERIIKYKYDENVDLYDPRLNIMVAMDYLEEVMEEFDDDIPGAIMAYNMGPFKAHRLRDNGWTSSYAETVLERMEYIEGYLKQRS